MNIKEVVETWSKMDCVRFAAWCARRVAYLSDDPRVGAVLIAVETWLEHPSEENRLNASIAASNCYQADRDAANLSVTVGGRAAYAACAASFAAGAATNAGYAASMSGFKCSITSIIASYVYMAADYASMATIYNSHADRTNTGSISSSSELLSIFLSETLMREVSGTRS